MEPQRQTTHGQTMIERLEDRAGYLAAVEKLTGAARAYYLDTGQLEMTDADYDRLLDAVRATQDAFALTAVDPTAVAVGLPVPDPAVSEDLRWWESCRVAMAAFPPPAGDAEFVATCAALGLCDATSPFVDADPEVAAVLRAAEEAGRALIDDLAQGGGTDPSGTAASLVAVRDAVAHLAG